MELNSRISERQVQSALPIKSEDGGGLGRDGEGWGVYSRLTRRVAVNARTATSPASVKTNARLSPPPPNRPPVPIAHGPVFVESRWWSNADRHNLRKLIKFESAVTKFRLESLLPTICHLFESGLAEVRSILSFHMWIGNRGEVI